MIATSIARTYSIEDCAITAIQHPAVVPDSRVSIVDYSPNIPGNDFDHHRFEVVLDQKGQGGDLNFIYINLPAHLIPSEHFIVTDKMVSSGDPIQNSIPLFYQYQARHDHYSESFTFDDLQVFRFSDGALLSPNEYQVEFGNQALYPNGTAPISWTKGMPDRIHSFRVLLPEYVARSSDGPWMIRYNRYIRGAEEKLYTEFIEPSAIFVEKKHFVIKPLPGIGDTKGSKIEFPLIDGVPSMSGYVFSKKADWARIYVSYPVGNEWSEWSPRVFAGSAILQQGKEQLIYNPKNDITLVQPSVNSSGNFFKVYDDTARRIDPTHLVMSHGQIHLADGGYPDYVPLLGLSHQILNPSGHGLGIVITEDGTPIDMTRIRSWSPWYGIFTVDGLKETSQYLATYVYHNRWLILRGIDLNPRRRNVKGYRALRRKLGTGSIVDNPVVVYISPQNAALGPRQPNTSIVWGYGGVDQLGRVFSADPRDLTKYILPANALTLSTVSTIPIDKSELILTDVRVRGGGIRDSVQSLITESDYFSDIAVWDGRPIRGEGVLIIQIPTHTRNSLRTRFAEEGWVGDELSAMTDEYVLRGIEKFIPTGSMYYIVDEYGEFWDISINPKVRS